MRDEETVPCGVCRRPTSMLGTKRCDRCYELESRIKDDLDLAQKILEAARAQERERLARLCERLATDYLGIDDEVGELLRVAQLLRAP